MPWQVWDVHAINFINQALLSGLTDNFQVQLFFMLFFQIVRQLEHVVISLIAKVLELSVMGRDKLCTHIP